MSSPGSLGLQIDPSVVKTLKKIPRKYAEEIFAVMQLLPLDPYFGDIEKMKGEANTWRRRIGAYRIFYQIRISERTILVFRVERRTSATY